MERTFILFLAGSVTPQNKCVYMCVFLFKIVWQLAETSGEKDNK